MSDKTADDPRFDLVRALRATYQTTNGGGSLASPAIAHKAADEIERLRATLRAVKGAIEQDASDTLWMSDACPETVCDFIEAALGENSDVG